ncbi:hypothetical protein GOP47_0014288 [Adiantum capillus-veneris]|uniref:Reverse transcriptase Ty1/copia-type domain-containing protein n=1 Tax=Adiantum capillus-veneris TaxID=13818 RepID=A0A9D4UL65_ADICA|nr:hypothetical protein GOP47_0014288 [Adiantum capillus-veneris]
MFKEEFHVHDNGPMTYFLGIEVDKNPNEEFIKLSQRKYIEDMLDDTYTMSSFLYARLIVEQRYLISCTRLDISFTGHVLSHHMRAP